MQLTLFSKPGCKACDKLRVFLDGCGITYEETTQDSPIGLVPVLVDKEGQFYGFTGTNLIRVRAKEVTV